MPCRHVVASYYHQYEQSHIFFSNAFAFYCLAYCNYCPHLLSQHGGHALSPGSGVSIKTPHFTFAFHMFPCWLGRYETNGKKRNENGTKIPFSKPKTRKQQKLFLFQLTKYDRISFTATGQPITTSRCYDLYLTKLFKLYHYVFGLDLILWVTA